MILGLTSEQLIAIFVKSVERRANEISGQVNAAFHNENPEFEKMLSTLRQQFPTIDTGTVLAIRCTLLAFMDTIVANNTAIAKTVPHLDA